MSTPTSFHKILIANRSEIALRVIRTARRMGFATVAVYSTVDRYAPHVQLADECVCIGEPESSSSYLNIRKIVAAALESGADAIHPGYGFLAENEEFAAACVENGLVFIGPTPESIEIMGDKAHAKQVMREAGFPSIPGYDGEDQDLVTLQQEANRIGYPVMIKATAGGGGRGMRVAVAESGFRNALTSAQSEAQASFGSNRVVLERAVQNPRHIEIQILADRYGNVIHLGERDCSIQRRHQKIIEETPAPRLDRAVRDEMCSAAVDAVEAIGYEGVGTLECLVDTEDNFYFMEMNTRLQVEHSITEEVTGLDLVEQQLLVASGRQLTLQQADVAFCGHAVEVRLCAEDCDKEFMPQSGTVSYWHPPACARVESAVRSGDVITPYYDSMFAKIITHGADRDRAILLMEQALNDTVVFGLKTNLSMLNKCVVHPAWLTGGVSTSFVGDHRESLLPSMSFDEESLAVAAAIYCFRPSSQKRLPRFLPSRLILREGTGGEASVPVRVTWNRTGSFDVAVNDKSFYISPLELRNNKVRLTVDGSEAKGWYCRDSALVYLRWKGAEHVFMDNSLQPMTGKREAASDGRIRSASSCKVISIAKEIGETVKRGEVVVTTEAMKTEFQHTAPVDGIVRDYPVQLGDQVSTGDTLVILDVFDGAGAQS